MPRKERLIEEASGVLEITVPGYPGGLAFIGAKINWRRWCESEVERIGKIPGHSPRIAQHRDNRGHYTGKILIVDDEFTLPPHNAHADGVIIQRFYKTRKQWPISSPLQPPSATSSNGR